MMIVPSSEDDKPTIQRSDDGESNLRLYGHHPLPEDPEVVYHYTSMETFLKIVANPAIHATGVKYLNDTTEREHLMKLVLARLPNFIEAHKLANSDIFTAFKERAYTGDRSIMLTPFAASFCDGGDLLTQWRSYCPNGNGVSIGFRTECLKRAYASPVLNDVGSSLLDSPPSVTFQKVEYLEDDQTEIDELITNAMNWALSIEQQTRESDPATLMAATDMFLMKIAGDACFIKNPAFSNEKEYRLLVSPLYLNYQRLEFRASKSTLIPYVKVLFPRKATLPLAGGGLARMLTGRIRTDFVAKVILGPTPNGELSRDAVECLLEKHSLNVEVVQSKVPFRDL